MASLRDHRLNGDRDIALIAGLIGDDARAAMLLALGGGVPLPANQLAARARVAPPTASGHLAKLVRGGLLRVERRGRMRYFSVAHVGVSRAIEALGEIAPARGPRALRESTKLQALRRARTCYDHLAGRLGVELFALLVRRRALRIHPGGILLGPQARAIFSRCGVDLDTLATGRRQFAATCVDWTERQPHLSGALGAALCAAFFERKWCAHRTDSRAIVLTAGGQRALAERLGT